MNTPGKLLVKPLQGMINRNTEWFGHMDPFLRFEFENQRYSSQVCKAGGVNPVWNDTIYFNRFTGNLLFIALLDHETMKDHDVIGTAEIDISDIFVKTEPTTRNINLFHDGVISAKVQIYFFFQATINQQPSFGGGGSVMSSKKNKQNQNQQNNFIPNINQQPYNNYQPQQNQNQYPNINQYPNQYSSQNQYTNQNQNQNQYYQSQPQSSPYSNPQQYNVPNNMPQQS